jgi:hypothetical protein
MSLTNLFLAYYLDPDAHGSTLIFKAGYGSAFTQKAGSGYSKGLMV